jgi:[FeFe] hydrogenase H-cluster maturation GTPase HydF
VQTIRDILDNKGLALTCTTDFLPAMLESLNAPPDLVVTDSQVFARVNAAVPRDVRLTSFSILMARYKGDLATFVRGARAIDSLREDDSVLIAEACTHHALEGDIAREKLPGWLRKKVGPGLTVDVSAGPTLPENLSRYALILHCGACMFTRKQLMSRLIQAEARGVPITNYGTAIAALNGILERVVELFPEILSAR